MATAPKPWLRNPAARARRKALSAARRGAWPAPKDAAEAGLRALQPYGGEAHRVLVFIRCGEHRRRGPALAWVCATDDGPVFWSVLRWMSSNRWADEKKSMHEESVLMRRPRDVFDLLEFDGPHPQLEVRCRHHRSTTLDRELVMDRVRASLRATRPLTLWVHPSAHSV